MQNRQFPADLGRSASGRLSPEPLSTRRVLREMAHAYREHWPFLLGAALLVFAPVRLLEALDASLGDVDADDLDPLTAVELSAIVAAESITTLLATVLYTAVGVAAVTARRAHVHQRVGRRTRRRPRSGSRPGPSRGSALLRAP